MNFCFLGLGDPLMKQVRSWNRCWGCPKTQRRKYLDLKRTSGTILNVLVINPLSVSEKAQRNAKRFCVRG